jgi:hypothetical protein
MSSKCLITIFPFLLASLSPAGEVLTSTGEMRLKFDPANKLSGTWSGGNLVIVDSNATSSPVVYTFDSSANPVSVLPFTIPGAAMVSINSFSHSPAGTVGLCGAAFSADGKGAGFIAFVEPDNTKEIVRTYPYAPRRIAMAADGTVWAAGFEIVDGFEKDKSINLQHGVLRHFSKDGKLIESFLPRSTLASALPMAEGFIGSFGDGVGWYAGPLGQAGAGYFEVRGGRLTRYPIPVLADGERVTGFATTANGAAFVSVHSPLSHSWHLLTLGRSTSTWSAVALPGLAATETWGRLAGSEGNELVFAALDHFLFRRYLSTP